ncbi:MAG TPA: STAS domain-containing protein [Oscillatoriaceae cyanobacterium]
MFGHDLIKTPRGWCLTLSGDLDTHATQELDAAMEARLPQVNGDLVVDLEGLNYLNSTGIRSFIRLHKQLKASGHRICFRGASAKILRIFHYCGLDTFFVFEPGADADASLPLAAREG